MPCNMRPLLEQHLRGQSRPDIEHFLTIHVPDCAECRALYEEAMAAAREPPPAPPPEPEEPAFIGVLQICAFIALGAVALGLFYVIPDFEPTVPRGATTRLAARAVGPVTQIEPYRVRPDGSTLPLGLEMFADDRLGFSILNTGEYSRVVVFALDENAGIYWLHPDWTDRSKNMFAPPILKSEKEQDVPPGTHRDWEGQVLTLFMIFSKELLSLRDVEERLKDPTRDPKQPLFAGTLQKTRAIRLVRIDPVVADERHEKDPSARPEDEPKTDELWPTQKPPTRIDPKTVAAENIPIERTAPLRPLVIDPFGPPPEAPTLEFGGP